jgi:hypothetical protein
VEPQVEGEWVELVVTRCQVAKDDITGNLDILNAGRPAISVCLSIDKLESSICLIIVGDDKTI